MDTDVWHSLMAGVRSADRRILREGRRPRYSDALIVKMYLWLVWHDRPLCWACDRSHYTTLFRPKQLPSLSQFCRRVKSRRVLAILYAVNEHLTRGDAPIHLSFFDGKALTVGTNTRDPDARIGYAVRGFAKGYKLHAWGSDDGRIPRFSVRPLNDGEAKIARDLTSPLMRGGVVLADANYDAKHLYQAVGAHDAQLLTPLKRIAIHAGPLRHMGPHRRHAIKLFQQSPKKYHEMLVPRVGIERIFSALTCFGGGLMALPPWVRRLDRVTRWVNAKIAIYHARLLCRKLAK